MKLTDQESQDLLDELMERLPPERQPGDIDAGQFAKNAGVTRRWAYDMLKKFVEDGTLTMHEVMDSGRVVKVWRKVKL